jgi:N-acetyl-gamma-glutamyl-phosphate reductase
VAQLDEAARSMYSDEPFVRVVPVEGGRSPRTKWTTGSNVIFVAYTINRQTGLVLAIAALDNLGKGAAGQAVQNANLMTGQPETAGLTGLPLWP